MPNKRTIKLVDTVSNFTKGDVMVDKALKGVTTKKEILSAFFMARRLGTNSPKTRVK